MNYIITKNPNFFKFYENANFCNLEDMVLPNTIAIDTETTGLKPIISDIFAIQIGTGENNYLIHCYDNNYIPKDVFPYLENKILVGQNLTFDLGFFYKYEFYPKKVLDTFIASKILHNGKYFQFNEFTFIPYKHNFAAIFEREMGVIYNKAEQKNIHITKLSNSNTIDYCFNDVDRLLELHDVLEKQIITSGALDTYTLHCNYIRALAYMEICGVPINIETFTNKIEKDNLEWKKQESFIIDYIYDNVSKLRNNQLNMFNTIKQINIDLQSPLQMIKVFENLGINTFVEEGKHSIAEDVIKKSSHEFSKIWLNFQSIKHDVTTFGNNLLNKTINGRWYSSYNPILDTARISTRKGDVNVLNLPANQKTRECVEAKEGYDLIVCDFEGQETRVGADITQDKTMKDSVLLNLDLHCAFARLLFPNLEELSDEDIKTNHKSERNQSKAPRFCFQFGGTGYTLAIDNGLPIEEGMRIEGLYKELHPGVYEYGKVKLEEALILGYIESTLGFKLYLPYFEQYKKYDVIISKWGTRQWNKYYLGKKESDKKKEDKKYIVVNQENLLFFNKNKPVVSTFKKLKGSYFRLCLNNPTQTTAAHQTKLAVTKIFDTICKNNHIGQVKICVVPHDEIVLESKKELSLQYKVILEQTMKSEANKLIKDPLILMEAEANIGKTWYDAK